MHWTERLSELGRRFQMLFTRRDRFDREVEEEMRLHRDLRARELRADGLDGEDAVYLAQRRFGNTVQLREEIHQAWGWIWLDRLILDLRYGARRLRQSPGFTTVAVLTLALGIGANTAIFTLVHAVMLRSLPVTHPEDLWSLGDDKFGGGGGGFVDDVSAYSYPEYEYLRDNTQEFSELAAFQSGQMDLSVRRSGDQRLPEHYYGKVVSGNYFKMLGVSAVAGRVIAPEDDQPKASPVAVMSYRTWHDHFASDPRVVGGAFTLKGVPTTVVGIAPPGFFGETLRANPPDFWLPLNSEPLLDQAAPELNRWNEFWLYAIGRLRPEAQPSAVQAHVTAALQQWLAGNYSDPRYTRNISKQHIIVTPASGGVAWMRDNYRNGLRLLVMVSGLVLLIACANIANLLLARGASSRPQTAMRVALGASRWRITQQILVESVLLAFAGGAAGLSVAMATCHLILRLAFRGAPFVPIDPAPSLPVLAFAFLLSLLTGLIFSAGPAWIASHTPPAEPMRGAGRSSGDRSARPQKLIVVAQAALSLVLLVGAGLLTQSLRQVEKQHFGFATDNRLIVSLDRPTQYAAERLEGFYQQLQERLKGIPGVQSASLSLYGPMDGNGSDEPVSINGKEVVLQLEHGKWPWQNRVSAHYFETVGTHILRGRPIDEHDLPKSRHVAVVNELFARTFFPDQDPIGQHFGIEEPGHSGDYEIVGLAEDAKYAHAKDRADPMFFLPLLQEEGKYEDSAQAAEQLLTHYIGSIQLRVAGSPAGFEDAVRKSLAEVDPNLTITGLKSFADQIDLDFAYDQLIARLTAFYGLLALVLASVGLYGVATYSVARRTNEIGIRMALGADRNNVVGLMLRGAMRPIILGLAIGVPVALAGARVIASQLYSVKSYDPVIFGLAVAVLAICAMAAAYIPARRAAFIDPMEALRAE